MSTVCVPLRTICVPLSTICVPLRTICLPHLVRSRYEVCVPDTGASIVEYQFGTHVVRMEQLADDVGRSLPPSERREGLAKAGGWRLWGGLKGAGAGG